MAAGETFHQAAAAHPKVFENHWIQMIRTGEVSGQLGILMTRLNENIKKTRELRAKVTGALIYPCILIGVAFASLFVMLYKVVPTFAEFFHDFGNQLPAITVFVINLSHFLQEKGLYILAGLASAVYLFRKFIRTETGARQFQSFLMTLPVVGELVVQSAMEKFASNLALLLKSGTPLLESLKTAQEIFKKNPVYFDAIGQIHGAVSRGSNLVASVEATGLFTSMLTGMVKIGEESGKLSEVLGQVAEYYATRVENLVTTGTGMLEPLIVIGMGVMVCGLLASIYIPMFQMAGGPGG